jgi:hypothetical protein
MEKHGMVSFSCLVRGKIKKVIAPSAQTDVAREMPGR